MTDYQRIKIFIEYLKNERIVRNQRDFVERIGGNYSVVSEILSGKRRISERFIRTILEAFPFLSEKWIYKEEGEMITRENLFEDNKDLRKLIDANSSLAESVAKLVETNSKLAERILLLSESKGGIAQLEENAKCVAAK